MRVSRGQVIVRVSTASLARIFVPLSFVSNETKIFWGEGVGACFGFNGTMFLAIWLLAFVEGRKEMFYLTTHSTHFIYSYMASDIWLRTILIVRQETRCRHIGYSFRLTARVLLYAPSHRQDSTYHGLCYTSRGALAGTRNSSMGLPMKDRSDDPSYHERTLLPRSYISLPSICGVCCA